MSYSTSATPKPRRTRPALEPIITRLRFPLAPFELMPSGPPHPLFPAMLLNYHLLTHVQLDSLAHYYHQIPNPSSPTIWTYSYPACMHLDMDFLAHVMETRGEVAVVGIKRRKFGRFIGLRGCDTPVEEVVERERWLARREEMRAKAEGDGFWGRRGWGAW